MKARDVIKYDSRMTNVRKYTGLSRTEIVVLAMLVVDGPMRVSTLADSIAMPRPSVIPLYRRLNARGLIAVSLDPSDGRATLLSATQSARSLFD